MRFSIFRVTIGVVVVLVVAFFIYRFGRPIWVPIANRLCGTRTTDQVIREINRKKGNQITGSFTGIQYPPRELALVALKSEHRLEVYARDAGPWKRITSYAILGRSGKLGPKLKEGDGQIPEGIYRIDTFNPNSAYHLSLRIDYPNGDDQTWAKRDGRSELGGDIYIHGNEVSIGCIAIGDGPIEDLFRMVHDCGMDRTTVVLTPVDFRKQEAAPSSNQPQWCAELYQKLKAKMGEYPVD